MSQTPENVPIASVETKDYTHAWQTILGWMAEGRSWSGRERNCCFLNSGKGTFADVSALSGANFDDDARGVAVVDWDHDGRLDLWVSARSAPQVRFLQNQVANENGYFAIRLEGQGDKCARDALGARVTVVTKNAAGDEDRHTKSLRAGEGFLSQSSKWLHFGLNQKSQLTNVIVEWPGGDSQEWSALQPNQHYTLRQGDEPQRWTRPQSVSMTAGGPSIPTSPDSMRLWLAARHPTERLPYTTVDDQPSIVATKNGRPLLLILWASWCQPCKEELMALSAEYASISDQVDILALAVDGVGLDASDRSQASEAAKQWQLKLPMGYATEELLHALQQFHDDRFGARRPLPIPTSLLLDTSQRPAAIYQGAVAWDIIQPDIERLKSSSTSSTTMAGLPFPGTWQSAPNASYAAVLFAEAKQARFEGDHQRAAQRLGRALAEDPSDANVLFLLADSFVRLGKRTEAQGMFERVIEIDPNYALAHLQLANFYFQRRDMNRAREYYEACLKIQPMADAHSRMGILSVSQQAWGQAEKHFRAAIETSPSAVNYANLGNLLLDRDRLAEAATCFESALDRDPEELPALLNLSWIRACAPDAELRDGPTAIRLAKTALGKLTTERSNRAVAYDRLAAAYAESRDYKSAIQWLEIGFEGVDSSGLSDDRVRGMEERLEMYRSGKPYRIPAGLIREKKTSGSP